jgi:hypothetical protein
VADAPPFETKGKDNQSRYFWSAEELIEFKLREAGVEVEE